MNFSILEHAPYHFGRIELICGPMFSGKTEELIRRTRRAKIAKLHIQVFKPSLDNRYDEQDVTSHSQVKYEGIAVDNVTALRSKLHPKTQVLVIDEVQFFKPEIVDLCEELADNGIRVIVAGLDLDYLGEPFEVVANLAARAEYVTKLTAICVECGQPASRSFRLSSQPQQILVGSGRTYEARCRHCYNKILNR